MNAIRTARERARAELTNEIKQEARRQLAEAGSAQLSLRAVARALGMASSATARICASSSGSSGPGRAGRSGRPASMISAHRRTTLVPGSTVSAGARYPGTGVP